MTHRSQWPLDPPPAPPKDSGEGIRPFRGCGRGVSLVETMVGLLCFSIGIASLSSLTAAVGSRSQDSRKTLTASMICQRQIDSLKLQPYAELVDGGSVDGTLGPLDAAGNPSVTGAYTVLWDVQTNVPEVGLKRLVVTTRWKGESGRTEQVVLETLVSGMLN